MPNSKTNDVNRADVDDEVSGPFESAWHALGDRDAEAMTAKAQMVHALAGAIRARGLTQTAAAELLGLAQPNLSRILSGHFRSVTMDQLVKHLVALGANVRVTIAPPIEQAPSGSFLVEATAPRSF